MSENGSIQGQVATIANGASLSDAQPLLTYRLIGIQMPATWTAANLTFQVSTDGTNYFDLYDETGTEVTVTAAASRYIKLTPASWAGIRYLKVRSGTTGIPVNQGGARLLTLVARPL